MSLLQGMGQTDILQVTDTEVMIDLNGLQEAGLPLVGGSYGAAESVVMSFASRAEAIVLSNIPEIYRQMTREIRGEIAVEMAYDGQTQFTLGLFPVVEGSVALYVDYGRSASDYGTASGTLPAVNRVVVDGGNGYGSPGRTPYTFRTVYDRLSTDHFSVDTDTGTVTLTGNGDPENGYRLSGGSKVYADYRHSGMARCHNLRDICIRLAATRFGMSLSGISDSGRDFLAGEHRTAMEQLYAIMRGEAGIDLLDQLKLVDETRQPYRIPRKGISLFM